MFCALKGATESPRRLSHAQMAVVIQLLPALDDVPPTNRDRAVIRDRRSEPSARVASSSARDCSPSSRASAPNDPDQVWTADEGGNRAGGNLSRGEEHTPEGIA